MRVRVRIWVRVRVSVRARVRVGVRVRIRVGVRVRVRVRVSQPRHHYPCLAATSARRASYLPPLPQSSASAPSRARSL